MRGIHRQIDGAGLVVSEERTGPRFSAVGGLEHASLGTGTVRIAQCRDVHDVWVGRMHTYPRDRERLLEADVGEGLAAIGGLVDTISLDDVAAEFRFTHPDIHDVRIRLGYGHRTDRRR